MTDTDRIEPSAGVNDTAGLESAMGLAAFRVWFGVIMVIEAIRYLALGWVTEYFSPDVFHFTYFGFDWVRPLPGNGVTVAFVVMAIAGVMFAFGLFYRAAAAAIVVLFGYVFLLEAGNYLNHFYLFWLVAVVMLLLPAHRGYSLDALRNKALANPVVAKWPRVSLRAFVVIVYVFAAIAKMNPDWLRGQPLSAWLLYESDNEWLIGPMIAKPWVGLAFSYGGLFLDLSVGFLLLAKRTRPIAVAMLISFHALNGWIFSIGLFPWFMMGTTTLFFEPTWPRRLKKFNPLTWLRSDDTSAALPKARPHRLVAVCIAVFFVSQIVLPFRHHVYAGDVAWNEAGHRFAWRMKLRSNHGDTAFNVVLADGETIRVHGTDVLTERQNGKMQCQPDMLLQFAHHLRDVVYADRGPVEIYADSICQVNDHPLGTFVDPDVDLAAEQRHNDSHYDWVMERPW